MSDFTNTRRLNLLFYILAGAFLTIHVGIVQSAGFTFPTPWPDEAHFLWQAHAFAEHFTLFAPQLNSERMIMWMPPGYLVFVGLFFKIVGSSLGAARFLSLLCMIPALIMLLAYLCRLVSRWWALGFWGLFIINARFIACSNIARMEALLLLIVIGAFLLIQRNRPGWGLLLLFLSPLVHFNGFLFLAFGLGYAYYQYRTKRMHIKWNRWLAVGAILVAVLWLGYAALAIMNWSSFVQDMAYQFGRKGNSKPWSFLTTRENLLFLILLAMAAGYAVRNRLSSLDLVFLALPAWLTWRIGHELWYEVLYHVGFLAGSLVVLSVWLHLVRAKAERGLRWQHGAAIVAFVVVLVAWNYRQETIEDMTDYPWSLDLQTMHYTANVPYITADDEAGIETILRRISGGRQKSVQFSPHADAFILLPVVGNEIDYVCPLFQERNPDLRVVHYSRNLPAWWKFNDYVLQQGGVSRDSVSYIQLQRSGTEQWYFVPTKPEMRSRP